MDTEHPAMLLLMLMLRALVAQQGRQPWPGVGDQEEVGQVEGHKMSKQNPERPGEFQACLDCGE
jgi:hypothetical protein